MTSPTNETPTVDAVTFYSTRTGEPYTSTDATEITRLSSSRGHVLDKKDAKAQAEAGSFDPSAHGVKEVVDFLTKNPGEHDRVVAAERSGRNRSSITGDDSGGNSGS